MFLDIDGTLIDIAASPFLVTVPPDLLPQLSRLAEALNGAVALVTGRSVADIDRLFGPLAIAVAAQHGAELRLPDQAIETLAQGDPGPAMLAPTIERFVAERPGLLIENKGHTLAVHYRMAPQHQSELEGFLRALIADAPTLQLVSGHCVFDLKPVGFNKGTAVRRLMRCAPFAGRTPVFIGDDTTDEDGFAAVIALRGTAIRVGEGATLAQWRIADPTAVRNFLADASAILAPCIGQARARA
jgi:trehalose 6-phosphate phosphatase